MSDRYALVVAPAARRALAGTLPEAVAAAAYEFLDGALLESPYRVGKRMRPPLAPALSARRGPYRVLYLVDDEARTVTVTSVSHRADAYRARAAERPSRHRRDPAHPASTVKLVARSAVELPPTQTSNVEGSSTGPRATAFQ